MASSELAHIFGALALAAALAPAARAGEAWPQWRGPQRDGVARSSPPLKGFPNTGPKRLWHSPGVPGQGKGGWGSVAVAGGRVFVYSNEIGLDPKTRFGVRDAILMRVGWTRKPLPADLAKAVEEAARSPELAALDAEGRKAWARAWAKNNAGRDRRRWERCVELRLERGPDGLTESQARSLDTLLEQRFDTREAARASLIERKISAPLIATLVAGLDGVDKVALDRVVCYAADDGKLLWDKRTRSISIRFKASATPTIAGERCLVVGARGDVLCYAVADGQLLWTTSLAVAANRNLSSSILVEDGVAYVDAPYLRALDVKTGRELWSDKTLKNQHSSPVLWRSAGKLTLLCNASSGKLRCVDAADGKLLWQAPGGGFSSVVVSGDVAALASNQRRLGILIYDLSLSGAKERWRQPYHDRGASPIITKDRLYYVGRKRAVCLNLADGALIAELQVPFTEFSSPVLADGKLLAVIKDALWLFDVGGGAWKKLGAARLGIGNCTSPALVDGRVYLRLNDGLACFDLRR